MSKNYARHIAKGAGTVFLFTVAASFLGYLIRLLLTRQLSVADYGLFYALFAFVSFFILFRDLGFGSAIVKFMPEFGAKKQYKKLKSMLVFTFRIQLIFVLLSIIFLTIFSNWFALHIFHQPVSYLIKIFSFILFADLVLVFERCVFQGNQKMLLLSLTNFLRVFLILILLFFFKPLNIEKTIFIFVLAPILTALILSPKIYSLVRPLLKYKTKITKGLKKQIIKFSLPVFFGLIAYMILGYTDTIMLTMFRSLEEVGLYQVALPTSRLLFVFTAALTSILFPLSSELWSSDKKEKLKLILEKMIKFSFVLILPALLIMLSFPKLVLNLFFGSQYIQAYLGLQILSLTSIFFLLRGIMGTTLAGIGKPILNTKAAVIMALSNVIINLLLIPHYGILGAATATLLSFMIGFAITLNYTKRYVQISFPVKSIFKSLVNSLIVLFLIYKLKAILVMRPITEFIIVSSTAIMVYAMLTFVTKTLSRNDIKIFGSVVKWPKFVKKKN